MPGMICALQQRAYTHKHCAFFAQLARFLVKLQTTKDAGVGEGSRQCEGLIQASASLHADTGLHRGQARSELGYQVGTQQQVGLQLQHP